MVRKPKPSCNQFTVVDPLKRCPLRNLAPWWLQFRPYSWETFNE